MLRSHWWLAIALSFGPTISNSFARFAYALVLPAMQENLAWSYSQAGSMNTANALGYLAGALLTMRVVSRIGNRRLFCWGLASTALSLIALGVTRDFLPMLLLRALSGITSAAILTCGGVLAGNIFRDHPQRASAAIAIYFGGAGLGMIVTGIGIPLLLAREGSAAWPQAWLAMGLLASCMAAISIAAALWIEEPSDGSKARGPWSLRHLAALLTGYFLLGVGYVPYMTFVIAWMKLHGLGSVEVASMWAVLGASTLFAPLVWRRPLHGWLGGNALAASLFMLATGAVLPLFSTTQAAMVASAVLFGGSLFIGPTAVTTFVKRSFPKQGWGPTTAAFTTAFALGQPIGPIAAGWLADRTGSLSTGLAGAGAILLLGALISLRQCELMNTAPAAA